MKKTIQNVKKIIAWSLTCFMVMLSCISVSPVQKVRAIITDAPLYANVDSAVGQKGSVYVAGWIFDETRKGDNVVVHVYIGKTREQARLVDGFAAKVFRSDVNNAFPGVGNYHGFEKTLEVSERGNYNLYFYALDIGKTGNNLAFYTANVTIKNSTHNITYNYNDGTGNRRTSSGIEENTSTTLDTFRPERTGYTFLGWSESSSAKSPSYYPGGSYYMGTKDVTLYAVWGRSEYTVSYNLNGGRVSGAWQSSVKVGVGESVTITNAVPVRDGYQFLGWSENASAAIGTYEAYDVVPVKGNMTLYAIWKKVVKYTIHYDANGGVFPTAVPDQIVEAGEGVYFTTVEPTKENCRFLGWADTPTATVANYRVGVKWIANRDITLYAVWSIPATAKPMVTVTYDANGGKFLSNAPSQTAEAGQSINITMVQPTKENCQFLGWSESSTAVSAAYQAGDKLTLTKNVKLYAVWRLQSVTPQPVTPQPVTPQPVEANPVTQSPVVADPVTPQPEVSKERKIFSVTYDANGGKFSSDVPNQTAEAGQSINITMVKPTKENCQFLGWSESPKAAAATYQAGDQMILGKDVRLYAIWSNVENKKITVTYDANGGKFSSDVPNQTAEAGQSINITMVKPMKENCQFLGWSESSTAVSATYQAGDTIMPGKNVKLYAVWNSTEKSDENKKVTISYNSNGGTGAPSAETAGYMTDYSISSKEPVRAGYTFLGWSEEKSSYSADYLPTVMYRFNRNVTLYAVWALNTVSLMDCAISLSETKYVFDGSYHMPVVKVTYQGNVLSKDTHYTVQYSSNKNAGTAEVLVNGIGRYSGAVKKNYVIEKAQQDLNVSLGKSTLQINEETSIEVEGHGNTSYSSADENIATVTDGGEIKGVREGSTRIFITSSGDSNYEETTETVEILVMKGKIALSKCSVLLEQKSYGYTGKKIIPDIDVKNGKVFLSDKSDYIATYSNNKKVGKATIIIQGKGNYTGTLKKSFRITKAKNEIQAKDINKSMDSKARKYSIGAKAKGGIKLQYKSNNKQIRVNKKGVVTVPKNFIGSVKISIKAKGNANYQQASKDIMLVITPKGTSLNRVDSPAPTELDVEWQKCSGCKKYELCISTVAGFSKGFAHYSVVEGEKNVRWKVDRLNGGDTYFVKVRTIWEKGGKTYYSDWSSVKSVVIR